MKKNVRDFEDYKQYIKWRLANSPNKGRGQFRKIALFLQCHTTLVSQIFSGSRDLTAEQALDLSGYLEFSEAETDYFCTLVDLARAQSEPLRKRLRKKLIQLKKDADSLSNRLKQDRILSDKEKERFYESWYLSAINLLTSIPEFQSAEAIAERLNMAKYNVVKTLNFLSECGLVSKQFDKYKMNNLSIHLDKSSPMISRMHTNWRIKAIERSGSVTESELMFTAPISISRKDFARVKVELLETIEKLAKVVNNSPPEDLALINIDYFWV